MTKNHYGIIDDLAACNWINIAQANPLRDVYRLFKSKHNYHSLKILEIGHD